MLLLICKPSLDIVSFLSKICHNTFVFFSKISTRTDQIGSVIRHALAPHLIKFEPEHGLIAITEIIVLPDLSMAKIFVDAERRQSKLETKLNKMAGALQREIARSLTQKRMPKLVFAIDARSATARRIDELLEEK